VGTDLTVYKPGNTSECMAAIVRGDRVYVCELLPHGVYERMLPTKRVADYTLSEFTLWSLPPGEEPPSSEEEAFRTLQQRCQRLQQDHDEMENCWRASEEKIEQQRQRIEDLQRQVESHQHVAAESGHRAEQLAAELAAAKQQLEEVHRKMAAASLPWWRKLLGR
jgi:hypothetical protein